MNHAIGGRESLFTAALCQPDLCRDQAGDAGCPKPGLCPRPGEGLAGLRAHARRRERRGQPRRDRPRRSRDGLRRRRPRRRGCRPRRRTQGCVARRARGSSAGIAPRWNRPARRPCRPTPAPRPRGRVRGHALVGLCAPPGPWRSPYPCPRQLHSRGSTAPTTCCVGRTSPEMCPARCGGTGAGTTGTQDAWGRAGPWLVPQDHQIRCQAAEAGAWKGPGSLALEGAASPALGPAPVWAWPLPGTAWPTPWAGAKRPGRPCVQASLGSSPLLGQIKTRTPAGHRMTTCLTDQ